MDLNRWETLTSEHSAWRQALHHGLSQFEEILVQQPEAKMVTQDLACWVCLKVRPALSRPERQGKGIMLNSSRAPFGTNGPGYHAVLNKYANFFFIIILQRKQKKRRRGWRKRRGGKSDDEA